MPSFTIGLDLGQVNDYSALAVVEHVYRMPAGYDGYRIPDGHPAYRDAVLEHHVRHLQRWELGTPYPAVVQDVGKIMTGSEIGQYGQLYYDATGVGRAVGDLLYTTWRASRPGWRLVPGPTIFTEQSKQDMVSHVLVALQQGRLHIAAGMALAPVLESELTGFRQKITASGRTTFDAGRSEGGGHGDTAVALLVAMQHGDIWVPGHCRYIPYGGGHALR